MRVVTVMVGFIGVMFMFMAYHAAANASFLSDVESTTVQMSNNVIEGIVDKLVGMVEDESNQLIEDKVNGSTQV